MACDLKPACNFFFGFLWCTIPMDTIDVELPVQTVQGIHTFRTDHTTESSTCIPCIKWMKPFPSLWKKIEAFEEKKKDGTKKPIKKSTPSRRSRNNTQEKGKSKTRRLDMSKFTLPKAKRLSNLWTPLPTTEATSTPTTNTTTRATSPKIHNTTNPTIISTCRTCKR